MKYLDEYRKADDVKRVLAEIHRTAVHEWVIMEVCGGQTHTIVKSGLNQLLPEQITLLHGPGCPVCVTPVAMIDQAIELTRRPEVILTSFGDMLRVPSSRGDLLAAKAAGGDVRMVYSPLDAVTLAQKMPERQVIFFAVGFETTAPATSMAVLRAQQLGLNNFMLLCAHVRVPPAIRAIMQAPANRVQGFLAAGHVCTVMGYHEYDPLVEEFHIPIVVTGFEPLDIAMGIARLIKHLEADEPVVENAYPRVVRREGNQTAQEQLSRVFEPVSRHWRGIGEIPDSGLKLAAAYRDFDAAERFNLEQSPVEAQTACIAGAVLQGAKTPRECPAFGKECTPDHPLGAPMVSSEGACAAYYQWRRDE